MMNALVLFVGAENDLFKNMTTQGGSEIQSGLLST